MPGAALHARRHRLSVSSHPQQSGGSAPEAAPAGEPAGDKRLQLGYYLPDKVVQALCSTGLTKGLYPWQVRVSMLFWGCSPALVVGTTVKCCGNVCMWLL